MIFGAQENKICHCFHFFPFFFPWSNGIGCHYVGFFNVEFQTSFFSLLETSLVSQWVNNVPLMQDTRVQFLDWENPLEKQMATHSSILAWKIPQRTLAGYSAWGCKELDMTEQPAFSTFFTFTLIKMLFSSLWPTYLGWLIVEPQGMAYCFIELCKPLIHDKAVIHEGENKFNCIFLKRRTFVH